MIFKEFPKDPDFYTDRIRPMVEQIIKRYGMEEWKKTVLTHELHGHVGIYSILGVKMGMAALNFLTAPQGRIRIISEAGMNPPVSCLNDGLQISTGATFGHGLISSKKTPSPVAAAHFQYKDTSIRIEPVGEIKNMIKENIATATEKFGRSPEYWNSIQELALKYWLDWDRNKIFKIEILSEQGYSFIPFTSV